MLHDEKHWILFESYDASANLTPFGSRNFTPVSRQSWMGYEKACCTILPLFDNCHICLEKKLEHGN